MSLLTLHRKDKSFVYFCLTVFLVNTRSLKGYDFIGANLSGTIFKNINFSATTFIGCDMKNIQFENCEFQECIFHKNTE